jgi:hypothetical protein
LEMVTDGVVRDFEEEKKRRGQEEGGGPSI